MSQKVSDERGRSCCQMCDLQLPAMALAHTLLSYRTVVLSPFFFLYVLSVPLHQSVSLSPSVANTYTFR